MDKINMASCQDFVSPAQCYELQKAGIVINAVYQWVVINEKAQLHTSVFDLDSYYTDSFKTIIEAMRPSHVLPAFQIKDMEKLIPDYLLSRGSEGYELSLDRMYQLESVIDRRMPDAFAKMVLLCLRNRLLKPEECVKKLTGCHSQ